MASAGIEVNGLSHVYSGRQGSVPALQDIAFAAEPGRFVVLVGPSGCGKSSLLMMMARAGAALGRADRVCRAAGYGA